MARPKKTSAEMEKAYEAIFRVGLRSQDVRKVTILQAVIELLATKGVDELTFDRIGKKVGMARSHVVYYFPNREALLEDTMRFVALTAQERVAAHLEDEKDWRKLLSRYVEANFDWVNNNRHHGTVFLLMYYEATFKKTFRSLHSDVRAAGVARIEGILKLSGHPWKDPELHELAKGIQALITGNLVDITSTQLTDQWELRQRQTIDLIFRLIKSFGL